MREGALVVSGGAGERVAGGEAAEVPGGRRGATKTSRRSARGEIRCARRAGFELPPVKKWSELGVCLIDGETVRFDGAGKYVRCDAGHDGAVVEAEPES